jgi:hypothetical protein
MGMASVLIAGAFFVLALLSSLVEESFTEQDKILDSLVRNKFDFSNLCVETIGQTAVLWGQLGCCKPIYKYENVPMWTLNQNESFIAVDDCTCKFQRTHRLFPTDADCKNFVNNNQNTRALLRTSQLQCTCTQTNL